jgi:hypothetical protein
VLTNKDRQNSLEYEDPTPAFDAGNAVHLHDTSREQASEGARGSGCREKDRYSQAAFMAAVPKSDAGSDQHAFSRGG